MIAIVDYGMGNLRSVQKALEHLGHVATVTSDPRVIDAADRVILPGVGSFGAAMERLNAPAAGGLTLADPVRQTHRDGRPLLGICLGMQLLLETSEELGQHRGLGLIAGHVRLMAGDEAAGVKIPHMGWNSIRFDSGSQLFTGLPPDPTVYFVHSYRCVPLTDSVVTAWCGHGGQFAAAIESGSLAGVQFHPEKSGANGLRILDNFARREVQMSGREAAAASSAR